MIEPAWFSFLADRGISASLLIPIYRKASMGIKLLVKKPAWLLNHPRSLDLRCAPIGYLDYVKYFWLLMKKIGLLSDTHRFLPNEIISFFEDVDEIWHAGDIGSIEVLNKLNEIAFVRGVFGNIDDHEIRGLLPEDNIFRIEAAKVYMTHIGGYPGKYEKRALEIIKSEKPDLFISGHSHILKVMNDKKHLLLHMNPGAAGKIGLHQHITALKFNLEGKRFSDLQVFEKERRNA